MMMHSLAFIFYLLNLVVIGIDIVFIIYIYYWDGLLLQSLFQGRTKFLVIVRFVSFFFFCCLEIDLFVLPRKQKGIGGG